MHQNDEGSEEAPHPAEDLQSSPDEEPTLQRLKEADKAQRYEVIGEFARGGMGAILRVWDRELRRMVAMKVVLGRGNEETGNTPPVDEKTLGRFVEEAQITGQLDHPGIVPVHEIGLDTEEQVFFTMKLVNGDDLKTILKKQRQGEGGWTKARVLGVILKVCEAMAYAHSKKVIHRDLKPANVMVGRYGEAYVMDWGLAHVIGSEEKRDIRIQEPSQSLSQVRTDRREQLEDDSPLLTMEGDVMGTPAFMSPEQARGDIAKMSPASDVYSMGAIIYQLLAGHGPYEGPGAVIQPRAIWALVQVGPPVPLSETAPDAPEELVAICEKAMARDSEERYPDMGAMADDLSAFIEGRVVRAHRTGTVIELRKWAARNRALASAIIVAVLIAIVGLAATTYVQTRAKNNLEEANATIRDSNEALRRSQRNAYAGLTLAAHSALQLGDLEETGRLLELCPHELRGWEWNFLALQQDDQSRLTLDAHDKSVTSVQWSPVGKQVLSTSDDGRAHIWNAPAGERIKTLDGHTGRIQCGSWSPDGTKIATASSDQTVRVWDPRTGRCLKVLDEFEEDVWSVDWSPDGTRLVTGCMDGSIGIWDVETGELQRELQAQRELVSLVSWSPDGSRVLTGTAEKPVRIHDLERGGSIDSEWGYPLLLESGAWGPEGRFIAVPGAIIEAGTGQTRHELRGHEGIVSCAAWNPDGSRVATAGEDLTLRVWDSKTGHLLRVVGLKATPQSMAWSPDGSHIVCGHNDGAMQLWDAAAGERATVLRGRSDSTMSTRFRMTVQGPGTRWGNWESDDDYVCSVSWMSDGKILCGSYDGTVRAWDTSIGACTGTVFGCCETTSMSLGSDSGGLLIGHDCGRLLARAALQTPIRQEWRVDGLIGRDGRPEVQVIWAPGGGSGLVAGPDALYHLFDLRDVGSRVPLEDSETRWSAAWSPDGSKVVTGTNEGLVVWDGASGQRLELLAVDLAKEGALAWSPDGKLIAALSETDLKIWSVTAGCCLTSAEVTGHDPANLIWSPDGKRLLSTERDSIRIWDPLSGLCVLILEAADFVHDAAWSPDGQTIAAGTSDGLEIIGSRREDMLSIWQHEGLRSSVRAVVDELAYEHVDLERVLEAIRSDQRISDELTVFALQVAVAKGDPDVDELIDRCWNRLGRNFRMGSDGDYALRLARRAVELQPDSAKAQITLARALADNGHEDRAVAASRRALDLASDDLRAGYQRAHDDLLAEIASAPETPEPDDH